MTKYKLLFLLLTLLPSTSFSHSPDRINLKGFLILTSENDVTDNGKKEIYHPDIFYSTITKVDNLPDEILEEVIESSKVNLPNKSKASEFINACSKKHPNITFGEFEIPSTCYNSDGLDSNLSLRIIMDDYFKVIYIDMDEIWSTENMKAYSFRPIVRNLLKGIKSTDFLFTVLLPLSCQTPKVKRSSRKPQFKSVANDGKPLYLRDSCREGFEQKSEAISSLRQIHTDGGIEQ
jgi:disulfide oxidoreductase YuzD